MIFSPSLSISNRLVRSSVSELKFLCSCWKVSIKDDFQSYRKQKLEESLSKHFTIDTLGFWNPEKHENYSVEQKFSFGHLSTILLRRDARTLKKNYFLSYSKRIQRRNRSTLFTREAVLLPPLEGFRIASLKILQFEWFDKHSEIIHNNQLG